MILYLLNVSFVWFISLIFFDLFLKSETFHRTNRIYLLMSLLLGIFLPFLSFSYEIVRQAGMQNTVDKINAIQQTIPSESAAVSTTHHFLNAEKFTWIIYFLGVVVTLARIVKEVMLLRNYYKKGRKTLYENYTLIETNQSHSAFSFGKMIFLSSKENYNAIELKMLLDHEIQHALNGHFLDKILLAFLKVAFWFHPLIYWFDKRLMLLHEYEADTISKSIAQPYGRFLVEQTLLQSHAFVTHSFNYSPIKNRIAMLTKNSSPRIRMIKYALMIPMLFVFLVCCTEKIQSQTKTQNREIKNGKMSFNGNEIEFTTNNTDTVLIEDPVTSKIDTMEVAHNPTPLQINGKKVYNSSEYTVMPILKEDDGSVNVSLFHDFKSEIIKLHDGEYEMGVNLLVNVKGDVAYYDLVALQSRNSPEENKELRDEIARSAERAISDMKFSPAEFNGQPINSFTSYNLKFTVRNGKAVLM